MRRIFIVAGVVICLSAAGAAGGWHWLTSGFDEPGPLIDPATLIIPKGTTPDTIAANLRSAGIIDDLRIFKWGRRFLATKKPLRAGEFKFSPRMSTAAVIRQLQSGKTVVRKVTIAEGLSNAEIADVLSRTPGLTGLPGAMPNEGSLLPETYHFSFGDARAGIIKRMRGAMTQLLAEAWPKRTLKLPLKTPAAALVLASIVEKETGVAAERQRVAGVFINRLRKGMRLQSDPTVVFGLTQGKGGLGRSITKADLKSQTPFNTYVIKGLPPSPIANPGRAAILAVLNPAPTQDLYFVADGSGGHAFAKTLKQHQRNVGKWRKIERARKKKTP